MEIDKKTLLNLCVLNPESLYYLDPKMSDDEKDFINKNLSGSDTSVRFDLTTYLNESKYIDYLYQRYNLKEKNKLIQALLKVLTHDFYANDSTYKLFVENINYMLTNIDVNKTDISILIKNINGINHNPYHNMIKISQENLEKLLDVPYIDKLNYIPELISEKIIYNAHRFNINYIKPKLTIENIKLLKNKINDLTYLKLFINLQDKRVVDRKDFVLFKPYVLGIDIPKFIIDYKLYTQKNYHILNTLCGAEYVNDIKSMKDTIKLVSGKSNTALFFELFNQKYNSQFSLESIDFND